MKNTVQIVEGYWAEHPAWFGRSYGEYLHLGANQELLRLMLRDVAITPDTRVLDQSCALGGNARWLASLYGCKVDGLDSFRPAIQAAKELAKAQAVFDKCHFQVSEPDALPFPDNTFDLALTAEGESNWSELARVLKKKAPLVGSAAAAEGLERLEAELNEQGFELDRLLDVTEFALRFYRAKEAEAQIMVSEGLMRKEDLLSLQMHTVDLYDAGSASHALFRARWSR